VWTDWAFPVLIFDLFLTGYDAQSINLFDVLALGRSITTVPGRPQAPPPFANAAPLGNTSNPNFVTAGAFDVNNKVSHRC
jgi:hypothetical protein